MVVASLTLSPFGEKGSGLSETAVMVGGTVSLTKVVVVVGPQLPAASLPCTKIVCVPSPRLVKPLTVPVTFSLGLSKLPSLATMAVPVPLAVTVSMKNSAALVLPLATSLTKAVTVGAVLSGLGVTATVEVVGPRLSMVKVAAALVPTLAATSTARACTVYEPSAGKLAPANDSNQDDVPEAVRNVSLLWLKALPLQYK